MRRPAPVLPPASPLLRFNDRVHLSLAQIQRQADDRVLQEMRDVSYGLSGHSLQDLPAQHSITFSASPARLVSL